MKYGTSFSKVLIKQLNSDIACNRKQI